MDLLNTRELALTILSNYFIHFLRRNDLHCPYASESFSWKMDLSSEKMLWAFVPKLHIYRTSLYRNQPFIGFLQPDRDVIIQVAKKVPYYLVKPSWDDRRKNYHLWTALFGSLMEAFVISNQMLANVSLFFAMNSIIAWIRGHRTKQNNNATNAEQERKLKLFLWWPERGRAELRIAQQSKLFPGARIVTASKKTNVRDKQTTTFSRISFTQNSFEGAF